MGCFITNYSEFRMLLAVISSLVPLILSGTETGWTSPILAKLNGTDDNPLGHRISTTESTLLITLPIVGTLIGSPLVAYMSQHLGRRTILLLSCVPPVLVFFMLAYAKSVWIFYCARVIAGIGATGFGFIIPIYICEISPPEIRGIFCTCFGGIPTIGLLYTYSVGPYISFFWYHITLAMLPVCVFIIIFIFGVESPYYYLESNPSKAEELLQLLRGKDDVKNEFNMMKTSSDETSDVSFMEIIKMKGTLRALYITAGMLIFSLFSGVLVVEAKQQYIFEQLPGDISVHTELIIIAIVQLVASILSSNFIDRFGRKPLFIFSFLGISFSHAVLGIYFYIQGNGTNMRSVQWLSLVTLIFFFLSFYSAVGPLTTPLLNELLPIQIKLKLLPFIVFAFSLVSFGFSSFCNQMIIILGLEVFFPIFSLSAFCGALVVIFFLIETKGKSLEQIQEELNGSHRNQS